MEYGKLLQAYKPGKLRAYYLFIFATFFAVLGLAFGYILLAPVDILPYLLRGQDIQTISIWLSIFCALGAYASYLGGKKLSDKPIYYLHEHGVLRTYHNDEYFMPLEKLGDLYFFQSPLSLTLDNLGFREDGSDVWELIDGEYSGNIDAIAELSYQKRVDYLLSKLDAGETTKFHYISSAQELKKLFLALKKRDFLNLDFKTLLLNKYYIEINSVKHDLASLHPLQEVNEDVYLIENKSGSELFTFGDSGNIVLRGEILATLLAILLENN